MIICYLYLNDILASAIGPSFKHSGNEIQSSPKLVLSSARYILHTGVNKTLRLAVAVNSHRMGSGQVYLLLTSMSCMLYID